MNPALLTLLAAVGIALCALLIVASGLIHTNLKRSRAVAAGGTVLSSRILDDLRPTEDLLVDFLRHSHEVANLLAVLSSCERPVSFAQLVHELRIKWHGPTDLRMAANLAGPSLFVLGLAGLIRLKGGGFVATEVGREVDRRVESVSPPAEQKIPAALSANRAQPASPGENNPHQSTHDTVTNEKNTMNTSTRNIIITVDDHAELEAIITFAGKVSHRARVELAALEGELRRAEIVPPGEIPADVITLNSRAELLDLKSKERMKFTLVLPRGASIEEGKISVLAPLGTAILGYRVGAEFKWRVPYGIRRLKVTDVSFQPEAALKQAA